VVLAVVKMALACKSGFWELEFNGKYHLWKYFDTALLSLMSTNKTQNFPKIFAKKKLKLFLLSKNAIFYSGPKSYEHHCLCVV
jgi:hypothetical protein